jgi:hypothetical protein
VLLLALGACTARGAEVAEVADPTTTPRQTASPSPDPDPQPASGDPYAALAGMLHDRGVDVWFETDLVARWLEGPASFRTGVRRLAVLARSPGTVGFKVADELGYGDGLSSPGRVIHFLRDTRRALAKAAPGAEVLVDAVVPEIGCLPWAGGPAATCAATARRDHPAATIATTSRYLALGLVDRLDLSTGLLDGSTYTGWGLTRDAAQAQAWERVGQWGWPDQVRLQSRKALAQAGGYQGDAGQAADDVAVFVDGPVAAGADAVDIWTWRQEYDGSTYSLLDPDLDANPLWTALEERHAAGVHLITHLTPSTLPVEPAALGRECDLVATVFDAVFVAAGTA